jgi:hypothetical protein
MLNIWQNNYHETFESLSLRFGLAGFVGVLLKI